MSRQATIEKASTPQRVVATAEPTRSGRTYIPAVDIIEKRDEFLLLADVPGASSEMIDVNFENGLLTIHAGVNVEQRERREGWLLHEYGVGGFDRSFRIGEGIDASRIEAQVRNGVLALRLPKCDEVRPRKIAVKSA